MSATRPQPAPPASVRDFTGIVWTGSGLLDLRNPAPSAIHPADIARGLSRLARFNGQTRDDRPAYSVAWHCLFCEALAADRGLPHATRLQCLLHDAAEAFMGDLITPVKLLCPQFETIEAGLWRAIARRFGAPERLAPEVKAIDAVALECERRHLLPATAEAWADASEADLEIAARWFDFVWSHPGEEMAASLYRARLAALTAAP